MKKFLFILAFCPFLSNAQTITRIAGNNSLGYSGDGGPATDAQLHQSYGIAIDAGSNVYVADRVNSRIRKIDAATGIINTFVGDGTAGFSGDGGPASAARVNYPRGICFDHSKSNLYIADEYNQVIRKIDMTTGIITSVAGTGTSNGYSGDMGPATAARLFNPEDVILDGAGNLYIADYGNNVIRKVTASTGVISTAISGCPYGSGACFPRAIRLDNTEALYVVEDESNHLRKKIWGKDTMQMIAGSSSLSLGDGGPATNAKLWGAVGIAIDPFNNIFIADQNNHRVRKVDAMTGIISTIAGNGTMIFPHSGDIAASAPIPGPTSLTFDEAGNLYVSYANDLLKISNVFDPTTLVVKSQVANNVNIFPNPGSGRFTVQQPNAEKYEMSIYNILGEKVYQKHATSANEYIDISCQPEGIYFLHATSQVLNQREKIVITR